MSLPFEDEGKHTGVYLRERKQVPAPQTGTDLGTVPWSGTFLALFLTKKVTAPEEDKAAGYFHARRNEVLLAVFNEVMQT